MVLDDFATLMQSAMSPFDSCFKSVAIPQLVRLLPVQVPMKRGREALPGLGDGYGACGPQPATPAVTL
jgi:hypothetical protein